MMTRCTHWIPRYICLVMTAWLIVTGADTYAQKPVVAAVVWDDRAKEGEDLGELRVYQLGEPVPGLKVKVSYEGTARNGFDYRCFTDVLEIDRYGKFVVRPILDGIVEGPEIVEIRIIPDEAYVVDPEHPSASVVIQDGDIPDVAFATPSSIHDESREQAGVKVILSKTWGHDIMVEFTAEGILAKEGEDYAFDSHMLVIPAGEQTATIKFRVTDDDLPEDEETVVLRLLKADQANISTNESHFYAIRNDDGEPERSGIYDKMMGTLIGFRAGCSMGAFTEYNWSRERIEEIFGLVDSFHPFKHYGDTWTHPVGATEDGGERHKLLCTAIMEHQDRIGYNELKEVWLRDCEMEDMYHMTQNYDRVLYAFARWGVEPADMPITQFGMPEDLGEHIHLTARTFQAIPCINAGDPENAIADMREMGKLYYEDPEDDAFAWGAVYNAAVALAMLPGATVESVIEGALAFASPQIEEEIRYVLSITDKYDDPMNRDLWEELTDVYMQPGSKYNAFKRIEKYPNSSVYENVGYAFALFKATRGNVEQSVIIATNRGYDTDCTAASAGALCGALTGTSSIPDEWIEILDAGTANNPYTNAHFTNKATADGLYRALQNKVLRLEQEAKSMEDKNEQKPSLDAYVNLMRSAGVIQ